MVEARTEDCLPNYHKNLNWNLTAGLAVVKIPSYCLARRSLIQLDKICKLFRILLHNAKTRTCHAELRTQKDSG